MHIYVSDIGALDDLLVRIHVSRQRPSYRRRLLEGIDALDGIGGLRVLRAIARQLQLRDRVSVGDIAVDMGIGQSSASRAVDDVCRRGLASKTTCSDDLRKARLTLSDAGRAVLATADANRQRLLSQATEGWSPDETVKLTELLRSEERRVGKERRGRGERHDGQEK